MQRETLGASRDEPGDLRLVAQARAGDEAAWEAIVKRNLRPVWDLSRKLVRNIPGAEEVTQETFRVVKEKLAEYRGQGTLCGWIVTICQRQAIDHLRRQQRRAREVSIEEWSDLGRGHAAPTEEQWVQRIDLERALALLEPEEREAFVLTAAGYTSEELAKTFGVAATTIRSRRARARVRLLRELEGGYAWKSLS